MNQSPQFVAAEYAESVLAPFLLQLSTMPYDDAASLPEAEERQATGTPEHASVWVYRENRPHGAIRVVVQFCVDHGPLLLILHHGQSFAEGFEFTAGERPRRLRDDELYDYT